MLALRLEMSCCPCTLCVHRDLFASMPFKNSTSISYQTSGDIPISSSNYVSAAYEVVLMSPSLISTHTLLLSQMSLRTFDHLLHYGELPVKRVVPLALALLYVSNPDYSVIDQLSRLSHDQVEPHER